MPKVRIPMPVLGMDNVHDPRDTVFQIGGPQSPPPRLVAATDVDIGDDGEITRRPPIALTETIPGCIGTWLLAEREWAQDSNTLWELADTGPEARVTGLVRRVAMTAHGGLIYVTDGATNWEIDGITVRPWGMPVPDIVVFEGTGDPLASGRILVQAAYVDASGNSGGVSDLVPFTADGVSGVSVNLDMDLVQDSWPGAQIWLALDGSQSMENEVSPGVRRWDVVVEAVNVWLDELVSWVSAVRVDIHVSIFGPAASAALQWETRSIDSDGIASLSAWLLAFEFSWVIGTSYYQGLYGISTWMDAGPATSSRACLLLSDGEPWSDDYQAARAELANADGVSTYTLLVGNTNTQWLEPFDNTPVDGVAVLEDGDVSGITQVLRDLQETVFVGVASAIDIYASGPDQRETTWVARVPLTELPYSLPAFPITAADPPTTALMSGPPAGLLGLASWRAYVLGWYDNVLAFSEGLEPHLWHADSFHQFSSDVRAVAALTQGLWVATADGLVWVSGDDALSVVPNYRRRGVFRAGSAVIEGSRLPMLQTGGLVALFCDDDGIVAGLESGEAVPLTAGRYKPPAGARVSFAYTERDGFRQILMGVHDA